MAGGGAGTSTGGVSGVSTAGGGGVSTGAGAGASGAGDGASFGTSATISTGISTTSGAGGDLAYIVNPASSARCAANEIPSAMSGGRARSGLRNGASANSADASKTGARLPAKSSSANRAGLTSQGNPSSLADACATQCPKTPPLAIMERWDARDRAL